MKSLCMINVKAGTVDKVLQVLKKKRGVSKDVMIVTGRADICVILDGKINENVLIYDYLGFFDNIGCKKEIY